MYMFFLFFIPNMGFMVNPRSISVTGPQIDLKLFMVVKQIMQIYKKDSYDLYHSNATLRSSKVLLGLCYFSYRTEVCLAVFCRR